MIDSISKVLGESYKMPDELPNEPLEESPDEKNVQPVVQIELTPECQQNLKELAKRYRSIRSDLQDVLQVLQTGDFIGDRLTGIGKGYVVLKVRVKNRDIQKGKSGGYRLIYQIESPVSILLLTLYPKSDREDITAQEVRDILKVYGTD
jgi:mRNA-degrading endonuclease RelE of RelBE toxin-antitoxin system